MKTDDKGLFCSLSLSLLPRPQVCSKNLHIGSTRKADVIEHLGQEGCNDLPTGKETTSQCLHCVSGRLDTIKLEINFALNRGKK